MGRRRWARPMRQSSKDCSDQLQVDPRPPPPHGQHAHPQAGRRRWEEPTRRSRRRSPRVRPKQLQ
eukprot:5794605-Alexandrium_andersonii.AAC.1